MNTAARAIVRIPILPFNMAGAYLVVGRGGAVVVDTGVAGSHTKILEAMAKQGLGARDLRLIVVTHGHTDHAGAAAELREATGAKILAHAAEVPSYRGEVKMTLCPTGFWGRLFIKTPLPHQPYTPFDPDLVVKSEDRPFDLSPYGVDGRVVVTPGHSAGSISVQLDSGDALVGDLVSGGVAIGGMFRSRRAIRPPFDEDPRMVHASLVQMLADGVRRFHLGHGGPIDAAEARRHADALALRHLPGGAAKLLSATGSR